MPLAFRPKLCMKCFHQYYLGDTKIVSLTTGNTLQEPPKPGTMAYYFSRAYVQPLLESQFPGQQPRRACPHCGNILPPNPDNVDSKVIAIIGATNVGKSHYTAMLINQLRETTVLKDVGCDPLFADPPTEKAYIEDYKEPLLNRREELRNTQGSRARVAGGNPLPSNPLYFELRRRQSGTPLDKKVDLVFFDAAGEDLTDEQVMELYDKFIPFASGIIFLIDPLQLETLQLRIPNAKKQNVKVNAAEIARPLSIITRVRGLFQQQRGAINKIKVPTAFVLSKSDVLAPSSPLTPGQPPLLSRNSPIFRQSVHSGGYDLQDGLQVNNEVRELLNQNGAGNILASAEIFEPHAFFAVSATGGSPDATRHFSTLSPLRVVDPLFWLLSQLGIIDQIPLPTSTNTLGAAIGAAYSYATGAPASPPRTPGAPPPAGDPTQAGARWTPPPPPPAPPTNPQPHAPGSPYDPTPPSSGGVR